MQTVEHTIRYQIFADLAMLDEVSRKLLQAAQEALATAHARYSNFKVGASVYLDNHEIISGSNQENAVYGLTLCAEHNVISTVGSMPRQHAVKAIAITASHVSSQIAEPIFPCGSCRQVLIEQELKQESNIRIIMRGMSGHCIVFNSAKDLLPFAFSDHKLPR